MPTGDQDDHQTSGWRGQRGAAGASRRRGRAGPEGRRTRTPQKKGRTSASSECLSREREACCNYWEITLRPNTSFAAPSLLHTHTHTRSKHNTPSRNNSNTLMHINTKSVQTGSRLQHLPHPRPILHILSQPENWQEPVGALCLIRPNLSHERRHRAPHLRDL